MEAEQSRKAASSEDNVSILSTGTGVVSDSGNEDRTDILHSSPSGTNTVHYTDQKIGMKS